MIKSETLQRCACAVAIFVVRNRLISAYMISVDESQDFDVRIQENTNMIFQAPMDLLIARIPVMKSTYK